MTADEWTPPAPRLRLQFAMASSSLNILLLPEALKNFGNDDPLVALLLQGLFPVSFQRIVFSLAAVFSLAPTGLDPALTFHAVQDGVEHAVGPFDLVARQPFHFLDQGITVTFAFGEEGKDQRFRRGGDEFFGEHRSTIHCDTMYVNSGDLSIYRLLSRAPRFFLPENPARTRRRYNGKLAEQETQWLWDDNSLT